MKVFISSVISGYEAFRNAVEAAITSLGYEVVRAENFPASTNSPQVSCLSSVRNSDLVILLVGERYGALQKSGKSATHEEFLEAKDTKPLIAFIERGIKLADNQAAFKDEVQSWNDGRMTKDFSTPEELQSLVTRAIHDFGLSMTAGDVDGVELLNRSIAQLSNSKRGYSESLSFEVSLAAGPTQTIVRPARIGKQTFKDEILQLAMFGKNRILDFSGPIQDIVNEHTLTLEGKSCTICVSEHGDLCVKLNLNNNERRNYSSVIVQEHLSEKISKSLSFCSDLFDLIDPTKRITHTALSCRINGGKGAGWQTSKEYEQSGGGYTIHGFYANLDEPVSLRPAHFKRGKLRHDLSNITEDIVALLERKFKGN